MVKDKIIKEFILKVEPHIFGYNTIYVKISGMTQEDILKHMSLIGELFFVIPCVGGVTICSIIFENDDVTKKIKQVLSLLENSKIISIIKTRGQKTNYNITKTDLKIIEILLKDARIKINNISKVTGLSSKTISRSLEKLQNTKVIQFTIIYDPTKLDKYISYVILVNVKKKVFSKTLKKIQNNFSNSFLQKPILINDQIVLFMYNNNIFEIDVLVEKLNNIDDITSMDLFMAKNIILHKEGIRNIIKHMTIKSNKFHISNRI